MAVKGSLSLCAKIEIIGAQAVLMSVTTTLKPACRSAEIRWAATFGSDFSFQDTSDLRYIGMQRHFTSFVQAADEASISRFYGGIHYLNSVNQGAIQGKEVSDYINSHLHLRK